MIIRKLTASDAQAFWCLRLKALQESPEAFGSSYEEESRVPMEKLLGRYTNEYISPAEERFVLGAFKDTGDLMGIVGFHRESRKKLRHKAGLWGMYIAPDDRRTGIGRSLLTELISGARSIQGLEQISLIVVATNQQAKNLYSSLGFTTYGLERNALRIGTHYLDEELMVLFIRNNA